MTDAEALRARMNGDYETPIDAEPIGGSVPPWQPPAGEPTDLPARKA